MGGLFDSDGFVPRAACGTEWSSSLIFANQAAHLLIFSSYLYIPLVMRRLFWARKNDFPGTWLLPCFSVFIFSCGIGHFWDVIAFYWPAYRIFTVSAWFTAIASWSTALVFRRAADDLSRYPSLKNYEDALVEARQTNAKIQRVTEQLEEELACVRRQEREDPTNHWLRSRHEILDRLADVVSRANNSDSGASPDG